MKLQSLIKQSAKLYLKEAGSCGKLLKDFNRVVEKVLIETTLSHFKNNISLSAKALGISRTSLYHKLKTHRIPNITK